MIASYFIEFVTKVDASLFLFNVLNDSVVLQVPEDAELDLSAAPKQVWHCSVIVVCPLSACFCSSLLLFHFTNCWTLQTHKHTQSGASTPRAMLSGFWAAAKESIAAAKDRVMSPKNKYVFAFAITSLGGCLRVVLGCFFASCRSACQSPSVMAITHSSLVLPLNVFIVDSSRPFWVRSFFRLQGRG